MVRVKQTYADGGVAKIAALHSNGHSEEVPRSTANGSKRSTDAAFLGSWSRVCTAAGLPRSRPRYVPVDCSVDVMRTRYPRCPRIRADSES